MNQALAEGICGMPLWAPNRRRQCAVLEVEGDIVRVIATRKRMRVVSRVRMIVMLGQYRYTDVST
jgi:hypothetical protein